MNKPDPHQRLQARDSAHLSLLVELSVLLIVDIGSMRWVKIEKFINISISYLDPS